MTITVVFDPPLPSDAPATFNTKAFSTLGDLNTWSTQANALAVEVAADEVALAAAVSAASASASAAATKAGEANTSAGNAATSATNAAASATAAASSFDSFDDRYLGAKASDPATDNDGNALLAGALYFRTGAGMRVWNGAVWEMAYLPASGYLSTGDIGATVQAYDADLTAWAGKTAPSGAAVGTTDAQTLTNKTITAMVSLISTNTTAVAGRVYVLTASLTLTLPATPTAGDAVEITNRSGTTTATVARNGQNIMGLAEDMTLDGLHASLKLIFADATRGWVIV